MQQASLFSLEAKHNFKVPPQNQPKTGEGQNGWEEKEVNDKSNEVQQIDEGRPKKVHRRSIW